MAYQMAYASLRIERSVRREEKAIALRVRHALDDFDQARDDAARALLGRLAESPRRVHQQLTATPEGVDLMLEEWRELLARAEVAARVRWTPMFSLCVEKIG